MMNKSSNIFNFEIFEYYSLALYQLMYLQTVSKRAFLGLLVSMSQRKLICCPTEIYAVVFFTSYILINLLMASIMR